MLIKKSGKMVLFAFALKYNKKELYNQEIIKFLPGKFQNTKKEPYQQYMVKMGIL